MTSVIESKPAYFLLPLQWSLYYYLTESEWKKFREKVKLVNPNWEVCDCPNKCKANVLDENWNYNDEKHIKKFLSAKYICTGCHWLKTPPWRIDLWKRIELGKAPDITEDGHIIRCLGWSVERVKKLREKDLLADKKETENKVKIENEVYLGKAVINYWKIDLAMLNQYGYSEEEITKFTLRMNNLEQKRKPQ